MDKLQISTTLPSSAIFGLTSLVTNIPTISATAYNPCFQGLHYCLKDPHILVSLFTFFDQQYVWNLNSLNLSTDLNYPIFHAILDYQKRIWATKSYVNHSGSAGNVLCNIGSSWISTPSISDITVLYKKLERFIVDNGINRMEDVTEEILSLLKLTILV